MTNHKVYLAQTDTTVGFLSFSDKKLNSIKCRDINKKVLQTTNSFKKLLQNTRIPQKYKNKIRRCTKTTFIYPNQNSFRIVSQNDNHSNFLDKVNLIYSSSANKSGDKFDEDLSKQIADVIIYNDKEFKELNSSKIYKVTNHKIMTMR